MSSKEKRLTEAELCAGPNDWILCAQQNVEGPGVRPCPSDLSVPGMLDVVCEEMDQTTGEAQCEAARRRLQEIEDRIIDEDEEVEADRNVNHLPSLVLSDTMKTGLKREFDEVFTKKMIESMSRPSMELVLWKPLPELLSDKPKPSSNAKNYAGESQTKHAAAGTAFLGELNCSWNPGKQRCLFTIVWRQLLIRKKKWNSRNRVLHERQMLEGSVFIWSLLAYLGTRKFYETGVIIPPPVIWGGTLILGNHL